MKAFNEFAEKTSFNELVSSFSLTEKLAVPKTFGATMTSTAKSVS